MRLHRLLVAVSAVLAPFSHAQQLKTVGVSQSQYWAFSQPAAGYPQGFVDYTGLLSGDESALNQVWYSNKPGAIAYFRPGVKNIIAASLVGTHKSDRGAYSFVLLDRTTLNFLDKRVLDGSTQSGDTSLSTLSTFTGLDPNVEYDFAVANSAGADAGYVAVQGIILEFASSSSTSSSSPPSTTTATATTASRTTPSPTTTPSPFTTPGPTTTPAPSPNPSTVDQCSVGGGTTYTTSTITTTYIVTRPSRVSTWTDTESTTDCGVLGVCYTHAHHYIYTRTYSGGVATVTSDIVTAVPVTARVAATACGNGSGGGGGGGSSRGGSTDSAAQALKAGAVGLLAPLALFALFTLHPL